MPDKCLSSKLVISQVPRPLCLVDAITSLNNYLITGWWPCLAPAADSGKHCGVWNEDPAFFCPAGPGGIRVSQACYWEEPLDAATPAFGFLYASKC